MAAIMRLLNTQNLTLHDFLGTKTPPYTILSHTWTSQELTYTDIHDLRRTSRTKPQGWAKIAGCCLQAKADGFDWVWIDTCCIDKSSSAELSEAINSMYAWYAGAAVCYAYLSDVLEPADFEHSNWFSRGWTLQELVAPSHVEFYAANWAEIGTRLSLRTEIMRRTGIGVDLLCDNTIISTFSVGERMSWACDRTTTRVEDGAYCLLGIFGVSMPLLYGEGKRAFTRLQEEIIRQNNDCSVFLWASSDIPGTGLGGILASSPEHFKRQSTRRADEVDAELVCEERWAYTRVYSPLSLQDEVRKAEGGGGKGVMSGSGSVYKGHNMNATAQAAAAVASASTASIASTASFGAAESKNEAREVMTVKQALTSSLVGTKFLGTHFESPSIGSHGLGMTMMTAPTLSEQDQDSIYAWTFCTCYISPTSSSSSSSASSSSVALRPSSSSVSVAQQTHSQHPEAQASETARDKGEEFLICLFLTLPAQGTSSGSHAYLRDCHTLVLLPCSALSRFRLQRLFVSLSLPEAFSMPQHVWDQSRRSGGIAVLFKTIGVKMPDEVALVRMHDEMNENISLKRAGLPGEDGVGVDSSGGSGGGGKKDWDGVAEGGKYELFPSWEPLLAISVAGELGVEKEESDEERPEGDDKGQRYRFVLLFSRGALWGSHTWCALFEDEKALGEKVYEGEESGRHSAPREKKLAAQFSDRAEVVVGGLKGGEVDGNEGYGYESMEGKVSAVVRLKRGPYDLSVVIDVRRM